MNKSKLFVVRIIVGTLLMCVGSTTFAQANSDTPESIAGNYVAAMQAGDWARCAALMHPVALADLKRIFTTIAAADQSGQLFRQLFNVQSSAEFAQLPDAIVFERLMRFVSAQSPEARAAIARATTTVIGSVSESPELVHVLYRMRVEVNSVTITKMSVMSFRRHGNRWGALLTEDIEGLAAGLSRRATSNQPPPATNRGTVPDSPTPQTRP